MSDGITDTLHSEHAHQPASGLRRWLYTTNHKDIGTLYLLFALTMFFTGGAMAMVMYELFSWIEKRTTGWAHRGSQGE